MPKRRIDNRNLPTPPDKSPLPCADGHGPGQSGAPKPSRYREHNLVQFEMQFVLAATDQAHEHPSERSHRQLVFRATSARKRATKINFFFPCVSNVDAYGPRRPGGNRNTHINIPRREAKPACN